MTDREATARGPWIVAAIFAVVIGVAVTILIITMRSDPPPEQPAPPGASLVPRLIELDAGPAMIPTEPAKP